MFISRDKTEYCLILLDIYFDPNCNNGTMKMKSVGYKDGDDYEVLIDVDNFVYFQNSNITWFISIIKKTLESHKPEKYRSPFLDSVLKYKEKIKLMLQILKLLPNA